MSGRRVRLGLATAVAIAAVGAGALAVAVPGGSSPGDASRHAAGPARAGGCGDSAFRFNCHARRFYALAHRAGPRAAFAQLRREVRRDGSVRLACHDLTHVIGHARGPTRRSGLMDAYRAGDPMCAGGYFHGVTAGLAASMTPQAALERPADVCRDVRRAAPRSFWHYSCVHGLGHGFMSVFGSDLTRSLAACDAIVEGWERETCYGGVFVENLAGVEDARRLRPREPLHPCTVVAARHKRSCYERQTAYVLFVLENDYAAAFALCDTAADSGWRPACHRGLGGSAAAHSLKHLADPATRAEATRGLCLLGRDRRARASCVRGAVRNFVHYDQRRGPALRLCAALAKGALRRVCRATAFERELALLIRPVVAGAGRGGG